MRSCGRTSCLLRLKAVTVSVTGELLVSALELLKAGVLKGLLSHVVSDPVNYVNAPLLAGEMGLTVKETRESEGEGFGNLLQVRCESERGAREMAGSVFGSSTIRLVKLDGFRFEVRPEGYLLIYNNIDRPGMLARVGVILAAHSVNIAGVSLGRAAIGENALTVMNIDSDIPEQGMKELLSLEGVSNIRLVRLD
jgi:D-3-phosphoglycerate dehydrogenase